MKYAFNGIALFFVLIVATSFMIDANSLQFGTVDFFQNHGFFFLIFITLFPRLTLLLSSVATGGFIWWLAFFFCPRILVATLATYAYFHTNPVLVVFSWMIALSGEVFEKWGLSSRKRFHIRTFNMGDMQRPQHPYQEAPRENVIRKDDAIEAEFRKG